MSARRFRLNWAFAIPPLLVFFNPLTQLAYIPVSVGLGRDLGMSAAQIGITIGVHSLATAVAGLTAGPLLDLVPARRVLLPAMVVNAGVSIVLWLAPGFTMLTVGRLLTGLASGAIALCGHTLVADLTRSNPAARDRGFSFLQTAVSVGAASALGVGALAASLQRPTIIFALGAVYASALLVVVLVARVGHDAPPSVSSAPVAFGSRVAGVLRGIRVMLAQRRRKWLMLSGVVVGVITQGSHYGVSVLLDDLADELTTLNRVGLSILIPCGVFTGSFINRWALKRLSREELFSRLYAVLPFVAAIYTTLVITGLGQNAVAIGLLLLGTCLGALMPLSVAISVAWNPELRGTATAAESLSRSVGQTTGPVAVGATVAAAGVAYGGVVVLAATVVGLAASRRMLNANDAP